MSSHVILRGSHAEHPALSEPAGSIEIGEIISVDLVLRRRQEAPQARFEQHIQHEQLKDLYGADPADIQAIEDFASQHELLVTRADAASRIITLSGTVSQLTGIFNVDIELRRLGSHTFRSRQGDIQIPKELASCVVAVFGFDERPLARTQRVFHAQSTSFAPPQVAKLYNFPTNTGAGQTIALIELGGGYRNSDLKAYWQQIGVPQVAVSAVSVDGARNLPVGSPDSADGEVVLDIEVAGGVAPGARIAVYFAGNTDQGFLDAIRAAVYDSVRKPSVISISWGAPESAWTPQAMNAFNAIFHDAALLGISVCAASGDNGSSDGEQDGLNHADFPASSPWVLGCGGTRLTGSGAVIESETVWNDGADGGATGGGVSSHFSKPAYQAHIEVPAPAQTANTTGRGVPDVSGVADPETGYLTLVDGQTGVVGGTSAVAPLWAGLIALLNEALGRNVGWIHPHLYGTLSQRGALRDITSGSNGAYKAAPGWDPCTGLGSPNGQAILNGLKG
ncbi:MAG: S8/S53 family peptidase [Acidobacteriaceae bacterium]|nr:S8/S53 family peptidase [Acidobacteriaceae bacterium]MBV8573256.1 S8/S53 family peptidase [Acidobacteriaceae bacterium]